MRAACFAVAFATVAHLAAAQQPAQWRLVQEWRVGGEVEGAHSFTDARDLLVLPDGRIVVLEAKDQLVHILSARGDSLKTIGGKGAGPGEFTNANGVIIGPKGQIFVNDSRNARITVLSSAGELTATIPHLQWGAVNKWDAWFSADGRLNENGIIFTMVDVATRTTTTRDARRVWSADFAHVDTIGAVDCPSFPKPATEDVSWRKPSANGRGMQGGPYPFVMAGRAQITARDGSTWIGVYPEYRVIHHVPYASCTPSGSVELRGPVIAVPASVRAEVGASVERGAAPGLPGGPSADKVRKTLTYFESMATDPSNRLWVERIVPGTETFTTLAADGNRRFDVYSARGALVAEVKVPPGVRTPRSGRPFVITDDHIYAFVTDADDVPYLAAFRIVR